MKEEDKYGILSIIFAVAGIFATLNKDYFIVTIITGSIAIAFAYLSFYIKQIKENTRDIKKIKEQWEIEKRLIKIENRLKL